MPSLSNEIKWNEMNGGVALLFTHFCIYNFNTHTHMHTYRVQTTVVKYKIVHNTESVLVYVSLEKSI